MNLLTMNPVLKKELRVSARTFKFPMALTLYSLLMAGVAAAILLEGATLSAQVHYTTFTTAFPGMTFFQVGMLCLIMPVLTAASISGEREKQTLDIMLTTPVRPMTILLGKLLASLSQLMLFIVCSIPAISICFIYGGLNWIYLLQFVVQSLIICFFIGAIGIFCSTWFRKTIVAIIMTMIIEAAFFLLPVIINVSVYAIKYGQFVNLNTDAYDMQIYMGWLPGLSLLDPLLGFANSMLTTCYGTNIVSEIFLTGEFFFGSYKSAPGLADLFAVWNVIYPLLTISIGLLFLYLGSRRIDRPRRENEKLGRLAEKAGQRE